MQSVLLPVHLIGTVSDRALILYALMLDRAKSSAVRPAFHDADGVPFVIFTVDEVAKTFKIGQTQAKLTIKELESAGLIVGKVQGLRQPKHYYVTDGKPTVKTDGKPSLMTDGKPSLMTDGKPSLMTDGKPSTNQVNQNQVNQNQVNHQSGGTICENQQTFDDLFLMMTTKDVVSEILCKLVAENQTEFAEINAEIIDFVAENVRKAAENKKIANLSGYARQALRHGKEDFERSKTQPKKADVGYPATYDIKAYESFSYADLEDWD